MAVGRDEKNAGAKLSAATIFYIVWDNMFPVLMMSNHSFFKK